MRLTQITPFVPCTNLAAQTGFYRDVLGFTLGFEADNYAFLRRDDVAVRLVEVSAGVDLKDPAREGSFYIDVQGIDALYAEHETHAGQAAGGPGAGPLQPRLWPA